MLSKNTIISFFILRGAGAPDLRGDTYALGEMSNVLFHVIVPRGAGVAVKHCTIGQSHIGAADKAQTLFPVLSTVFAENIALYLFSVTENNAAGDQKQCRAILPLENIFTEKQRAEKTGKQRLGKFDNE